MSIERRVYFSLPKTTWRDGHEIGLNAAQFDLVKALARRIDGMGYIVQVFARFGIPSDPDIASTTWSYEAVERVMRRCAGAIFIGVPRWIVYRTDLPGDELRLGSDFSHFEAGMAVTLGLPRLVLVEKGLQTRVVFDKAHEFITYFPQDAGAAWLEESGFLDSFQAWTLRLQKRRDVFLGYASDFAGLAENVKLYLTEFASHRAGLEDRVRARWHYSRGDSGGSRALQRWYFPLHVDDALAGGEEDRAT